MTELSTNSGFTVTYRAYFKIYFFSFMGPIFLTALSIMTQSHEKSLFLTFFILVGWNSFSGFVGTPVSYAWMNSSTIIVTYLYGSTNGQFYFPWKWGALISVAFLEKSLLVSLKQDASWFFRQLSRASPIRFLRFTLKLSHCSTSSH